MFICWLFIGSSEFTALFHQHRQPQRQHKPTDGSLSDTTYSNYSDLQNYYSTTSNYSSWLRNNSAYTASLPARASTGKFLSTYFTSVFNLFFFCRVIFVHFCKLNLFDMY